MSYHIWFDTFNLLYFAVFVPHLFKEKQGDKVFGIPSVPRQEVGILCSELLLQFYLDCFET